MPVDGAEGCLRAFTQLRQQYSEMKVILSIGGGGTGSQYFAAVTSNPIAVEKFLRTAKSLVDQFDLDGLDSMDPLDDCISLP
jgi:chitinase